VKDILHREVQNMNELHAEIIRAPVCVISDLLAVPGKKLNVILMCVVPLMVPILRSIKHIRNFMMSGV